ncbi:testis-expressed protein 10-like [Orbicella faveolata]|uniref:testis-expressed protein 10-like n=1 Tax=Orbicella faveolata TaxID=48498 RepID=UPI0009E63DF3|nr:testis-expressed protein 10-like [Orbicella faveolata]
MNHVDVSSSKPIFHFQKHLPTQIQVLQHSVEEPMLLPFTFDNTVTFGMQSVNTGSESNILTDGQKTKDFMETIVPLLLECWVECNPAQVTTGLPDSVMSPSSINVMLAIAEIFKVIFKAAERNQTKHSNILEQTKVENFLPDIYRELNHHFMSHFPFTACHTPLLKKEKKKFGKSSQQDVGDKISSSVLTLNLAICEVMLQFVRNDVALKKKYHSAVQKLEDFVIESLLLKAKGGAWAQQFQTEHVESLIKFAHQILCGKQDSDTARQLLSATFNLYQSSHIMCGTKKMLMVFFSSLAFPENPDVSRHEEVHAVVQKWLQGLPSVLLLLKDASPSMTELVLRDMKKAMVQCVPQPDHNFLAHLSLFFSKNSGPFVNLSETIQRSAVELLFHLPSLDDSLLQNIVCCCHGGQVGLSVIQYILQILHYRSPGYQGFMCHPAAFSLETYSSVLLNVAVGFSKKQLTEYQDTTNLAETHKLTDFM